MPFPGNIGFDWTTHSVRDSVDVAFGQSTPHFTIQRELQDRNLLWITAKNPSADRVCYVLLREDSPLVHAVGASEVLLHGDTAKAQHHS